MFRNILVPVDVDEADVGQAGTDLAIRMAKAFDSNLKLIHVCLPVAPTAHMEYVSKSYFDEIEASARKRLEALAAQVGLPAERVSCTVRTGGIYPTILDEAAKWPADLVVIGAHKPSMATYLLGSTAAAIVRHATCTVMVARSDKKASVF